MNSVIFQEVHGNYGNNTSNVRDLNVNAVLALTCIMKYINTLETIRKKIILSTFWPKYRYFFGNYPEYFISSYINLKLFRVTALLKNRKVSISEDITRMPVFYFIKLD